MVVRGAGEICFQMRQRQMDDVAVVCMLFARRLGQVEPEAMNALNIFLGEVRCVRSEQKSVRLPLRIHTQSPKPTPSRVASVATCVQRPCDFYVNDTSERVPSRLKSPL